MSTAWEKFQDATLSLARAGSIKDRLADAYCNHLADVEEEDLPREIREEFRAVSCSLNREPPLLRGEGAARATIRKMSNEEADQLACCVVRIFCALPRSSGQMRHSAAAQVVPLYLAEGSRT
ncbi:MAG TPA: hypothetical protein VLW26_12615 [Steroidobacteraceae bacterium]|nr:hypothetical protein [Steroidobacteraceae bacterium]